ncbi:MAG: type II secretion system F family protein [Planctomycetota bacterium]|jgi:type II secretory pathway component PulF
MNYQYTAKSIAGELVTGFATAASPAEVQTQLREKDLFVVSVRPSHGRSPARGVRKLARRGRVSKRDLMTLTSRLAIMSRSGVDLATALDNVCRQCSNPTLKSALKKIHGDVLSGKSISKALANHEHIFGPTYVAGMAAAEKTGRLPEVLDRLANLLRSEIRMRSTLRTLLAYPVLLASISALVVLALMFFVLPQFSGVFEQLGVELPAITQLLLDVAAGFRSRAWLWGGLGLGAVVGLVVFVSSQTGRRFVDGLLLKTVLLRDVTRSLLIGRAFRLLGTMIESGVPLLEGLRLTRSSIRNSHLRDLFRACEEEVLNGRGLSNSFLNSPFVPSAASQMIATAERTGTLAMVTQMVGDYYEEEGETRLRELATVVEPLIIMFMGVVVAFVVMSVMLPVFDFASIGK